MLSYQGFASFLGKTLLAGAVASALVAAPAAATAATAGAATSTATLPSSLQAWRQAAETDIEAAVRITRENHPGQHDPHHPGFKARLEAARAHGLALAARVTDAAGYAAAVLGFNASIGDGHAGMMPAFDDAATPPLRWPGFVTVWRGDALYVHSALAGQPAPGSKLLGCDGQGARELIRRNVFSFDGRADEAGQWWLGARRLFIDYSNPFIALPQRCQFERDGKTAEHALAWRTLDAEGEEWLEHSNFGKALPVGMTQVRPGLYWMAMPTFHPDEAERAAYRASYEEVRTRRAQLLAADAVVIDLRRNRGGSSEWSRDFAKALFGDERVSRALAAYNAKTRVWWRASPGNTAYLTQAVDEFVRQGRTGSADWARTHSAGMRAALARGETFYVEPKDPAAVQAAAAAVAKDEVPAFERPLYVVVPGNCASACLDAVDVFTRFPNTILVGAPSSGDSTYMDVRSETLPSKLGRVIVPNKVYVDRPRGNGQVYEPQLPVTDVVWSLETLQRRIEADLARKR